MYQQGTEQTNTSLKYGRYQRAFVAFKLINILKPGKDKELVLHHLKSAYALSPTCLEAFCRTSNRLTQTPSWLIFARSSMISPRRLPRRLRLVAPTVWTFTALKSTFAVSLANRPPTMCTSSWSTLEAQSLVRTAFKSNGPMTYVEGGRVPRLGRRRME